MNLLHVPVLQDEILQFLSRKQYTKVFDGTVGNAGHANKILEAHPEILAYFACDQDQHALVLARENLSAYKEKTEFIHSNFCALKTILEERNTQAVDLILLDLGLSSMQLDETAPGFVQRGFSFLRNGPLDMRMNEDNDLTAEYVVNNYPAKKLGEIFREFGEEPMWKSISKAIYESRKKKKITTTLQLVEVIQKVKKKRGRLHPATLVFQALRIFVNQELKVLEQGLYAAISCLQTNGSLLVISFHSLEDRIVKNVFRNESKKDSRLQIITKKPIVASRTEIRKNPRARSAKLRVLEKQEDV